MVFVGQSLRDILYEIGRHFVVKTIGPRCPDERTIKYTLYVVFATDAEQVLEMVSP